MRLLTPLGVSFLLGFSLWNLVALGADVSDSGTSAYMAGVRAYRRGDYQQALPYFQRVLSQDARYVNAHYYMALVLDNLGRREEAAVEYRYVLSHGREPRIVTYAKERLGLPLPKTNVSVAARPTQVALVASGGATMDVPRYRGTVSQIAVPLKSGRNALMLDAGLKNGEYMAEGAFILDTGATYTSISQDMADQLGLDLAHCEKVRITTANGRIDVPKITIETLSVNGLEAHNIEATVIPVRAGSSFSGLLGLSFIRQFVLTIDSQAGQLVFRKN